MSQDTGMGHMQRESGGMSGRDRTLAAGGMDASASWAGLLASAGPRDHIVQLYQDQQFLNRAAVDTGGVVEEQTVARVLGSHVLGQLDALFEFAFDR